MNISNANLFRKKWGTNEVATPASFPIYAKKCAFTLAIRSGVVLTLPLILRDGKGT